MKFFWQAMRCCNDWDCIPKIVYIRMTAKILCSHWNVNEHFFSEANNFKEKHVKNVKMGPGGGVL
jgi:hypothetical protein